MTRLLLLCIALLGAGYAPAATLLVVGDSISAGYGVPTAKGWVKLLENRSVAAGFPHQVVNASVSGDTTAGGLSRLPSLLRQYRPQVVVIGLGGNDGLRGLPLPTTRKNLAEMVRLAGKSGARVVLLGMDIPPNYGPRYTQEFRDMYPAVAKAAGAAIVPSFLVAVGTDPELMQADGIHPNSLAQPKLVDTVWPVIEPALAATR